MFNFLKEKKEPGLLGPDPRDSRDFQLAEVQEAVTLPSSFSLIEKMSSVQKQFWGTCTSHAVDAVKEYQEGSKLSQRFIYYNTKVISGLWTTQGDYLRTACKAVTKYGAPEEQDFPDSKDNSWKEYLQKRPSDLIYKKAEAHKGKSYFRVRDNLDSFLNALYQNLCPIATGMHWNSVYRPGKTGRLSLPTGRDKGGHAISCVGWEDENLWFRNSWGKTWGALGYFYIPFKDFIKHEIWDAWVLIDLPKAELITEGWVAKRYLEKVVEFKGDDIVKTSVSKLNVRANPNGKVIRSISPLDHLKIKSHSDNGKQVGEYKWYLVSIE